MTLVETGKNQASDRVSRLRAKVLTAPEICIERARLMTESYKETQDDIIARTEFQEL